MPEPVLFAGRQRTVRHCAFEHTLASAVLVTHLVVASGDAHGVALCRRCAPCLRPASREPRSQGACAERCVRAALHLTHVHRFGGAGVPVPAWRALHKQGFFDRPRLRNGDAQLQVRVHPCGQVTAPGARWRCRATRRNPRSVHLTLTVLLDSVSTQPIEELQQEVPPEQEVECLTQRLQAHFRCGGSCGCSACPASTVCG